MTIDASRMINALVEAELTSEQWEKARYLPRGNVVTVAHDLGSGGRAVAQALAKRLGVQYYDKEILDAIVQAVPEDRYIMERLDRQVSSTREEIMHQIVAGKSAMDEYRRHLIDVILNIARHNGVIVGRDAANFILAKHKVFRVRIVGSPEVCARRVAAREAIPEEEALRQVRQAREDHVAFCRQLCGRDLNEPENFDLILNTDHIPAELAAESIVPTMHLAGFKVPHQAPMAYLKRLIGRT